MKRTGRPSFCILAVFFAFLASGTIAQPSITVDATISETTIYTGERVSLSVEVSGDFNSVSRPDLPQLEGFRILSNNPSTSRSYSFVNGRTSSSYSYTYYIIAQDKGKYEIPSIPIQIDGEVHETNPIAVEIVDRNASATDPSAASRPDIFLQMALSDDTPVTGQQLIADVILYFKDGLEVNSYQPMSGWKAGGFWKEELKNSERPRAESVVVEGVRYRRARLLQFALFPTKTGELTINPYEITVAVRSVTSRDDPFSSFFGGFGSNQRQVRLETDPVNIEVQSLPELTDGRYIGAVGSFDISRSINTKNTKVGESVEVTTRVNGTGNIPLISKPAYEFPQGLEVYEPQENTSMNRRASHVRGSKTFTDIVIAHSPGTFTIPEEKLAYFDPNRDRYITKVLPAITFSVERDRNAIASSESPLSFTVRPVTGLTTWVSARQEDQIWSRWWFWGGLVVPLFVLGVGYWQKTYRERMETDGVFARSRKASSVASERLKKAVELSEQGDIKDAYNTLQKALTGFIGDRLGLPEAGLSNQEYIAALDKEEVDPDLVKNVRMLLDKCATISYAPDTSHAYLKSHVGLAQSSMDKLKKVL